MMTVVKPLFRNSYRAKTAPFLPLFLADPIPQPLGGALSLSCVESLNSHRPDLPGPPQLSARRSIARLHRASSSFPKKVSGALNGLR